jgi:hypothetical protein
MTIKLKIGLFCFVTISIYGTEMKLKIVFFFFFNSKKIVGGRGEGFGGSVFDRQKSQNFRWGRAFSTNNNSEGRKYFKSPFSPLPPNTSQTKIFAWPPSERSVL